MKLQTDKPKQINYWPWSTRRLLQEAATQSDRGKLVVVFRVLRWRGIDPDTGRVMI